jgi:hypothetical protein
LAASAAASGFDSGRPDQPGSLFNCRAVDGHDKILSHGLEEIARQPAKIAPTIEREWRVGSRRSKGARRGCDFGQQHRRLVGAGQGGERSSLVRQWKLAA